MAVHPYHKNADDLLARLRKIEGQVRGLQKMIQEDRYCIDILAQIASVKSAITKVELALLESHTRGCVADAIRGDGGEERIEELMQVIRACAK
jgi:DNA-binding FrmR family transcriptional regulator